MPSEFENHLSQLLSPILGGKPVRVKRCSHRSFTDEDAAYYGLDPERFEVTRCYSCSAVFRRRFGGRRVRFSRAELEQLSAWRRQSQDVARTVGLANLRHHGSIV